MRRIVLLAYVFGWASWLLLCVPQTVRGADPQLEKVLAAWQERQNWFQAIEYQVSGTHKVPRGAYTNIDPSLRAAPNNRVNPPQDVEGPESFTILLDFVKGRHRRDIRDQQFDAGAGKLGLVAMKDAFNGTVMKCLIPKEQNPGQQVGITQPEMTIVSGNMKNGEFRSNYYPIFFAHGRIYTAIEPILPGGLKNKPDPNYLHIHGRGVYEDRACLILRTQTLQMMTTSFDEYWVDTERECAIVRYLAYSGKNPSQEIGIRYQKFHEHWLPETWRWIVYLRGKTLYYEDMRVKHIAINPPITDADFELEDVKPGMLVTKRTDLPTNNPITAPKSESSVYRVKDDGGWEQIPDPAHGIGDQYRKLESHRWAWVILAVLLVAGLGFGTAFWVRRRRRQLQ